MPYQGNQCNSLSTGAQARTEEELLCLFADNTQGSISAKDLRDFVVSTQIGRNWTGPTGSQGQPGPTGLQGPQGKAGSQGEQGPQGAQMPCLRGS